MECVRTDHPEFWRDALGAPGWVAHHRRVGFQFQFRWYMEPVGPLLRWLATGSARNLSEATRLHHREARRLLLASGLALVTTFAVFLRVMGFPFAIRFSA